MKCPKCGSENVLVQREEVSSSSTSVHGLVENKKHHGIIWWVCIGWWWKIGVMIEKFVLAVCTMGLSLLFRKKKRYTATTVTDTKVKNKTVAVCQNCGKTWNV